MILTNLDIGNCYTAMVKTKKTKKFQKKIDPRVNWKPQIKEENKTLFIFIKVNLDVNWESYNQSEFGL